MKTSSFKHDELTSGWSIHKRSAMSVLGSRGGAIASSVLARRTIGTRSLRPRLSLYESEKTEAIVRPKGSAENAHARLHRALRPDAARAGADRTWVALRD